MQITKMFLITREFLWSNHIYKKSIMNFFKKAREANKPMVVALPYTGRLPFSVESGVTRFKPVYDEFLRKHLLR